ncbi:GGDEF domain-containing protein [Angustibacter luteus]|uniref:Diguanylate cyclase domain-containing protein n=1 Tax=Angustibacter luteus TaxID=658456 RepID=A0ABW1JCK1_9ACTN
MDDVSAVAARLLERGQSGEHAEVVAESERLLREPTGDLVDGPAGLHFARAVAYMSGGDEHAALAAAELMIKAAEREESAGWLSCGLSLRAVLRVEMGEQDVAEHDLETVLRDLVDAEDALLRGVEDPWLASNAHTGIALPFHSLRLYELALPHYTAAYEASTRGSTETGAPAMWLLNLAEVELDWALELYRVELVADAEKHSRDALEYAVRAGQAAAGPDAERWRTSAGIQECCARISCGEDEPALGEILTRRERAKVRGATADLHWSAPFVAVALGRVGRSEEALDLLRETLAEANARAAWIQLAALQHTRAYLLAEAGLPGTAETLEYGQTLAHALWRQRLRTLHVAETMRSFDTLRHAHDQAARSALVDPLTGIANRRAFDDAVASHAALEPRRPVAALVIDLDRFKDVNDTHGHDAGDALLRTVAGALSASVREGDLVARLGGDEFAALLPGADAVAAQRVAQRMVDAVDALPDSPATASIGVCSTPAAALPGAITRADQAMYAAKRAGGNRVTAG